MLKRQAVLYLKRVLFVANTEFHTKSSISTPKKTTLLGLKTNTF